MKTDKAQKWRQTWEVNFIEDPTDDEATNILCESRNIRGNDGYGMHLNALSEDTLHLALKMLWTAQQRIRYPSLYTIHPDMRPNQEQIHIATTDSTTVCVQHIID